MSTIYCLAHFTTSIKGPLYLENWLVAVSIRVVVKAKKPTTSAGQFEEIIDITTKFELWPNMRLNLEKSEGKKPDFKGHPYFLMANKVPLFLDHHKKRRECLDGASKSLLSWALDLKKET